MPRSVASFPIDAFNVGLQFRRRRELLQKTCRHQHFNVRALIRHATVLRREFQTFPVMSCRQAFRFLPDNSVPLDSVGRPAGIRR